jgi:hypothetical protein
VIDTSAVKWKRGFFRLWVVLAAFWALAVVALAQPWDTINQYREATTNLERFASAYTKIDAKVAAGGGTSDDGTYYDVERLKGMREELEKRETRLIATIDGFPSQVIEFLSVLIGVPLSLLGFGSALAWVLGGFRRSN